MTAPEVLVAIGDRVRVTPHNGTQGVGVVAELTQHMPDTPVRIVVWTPEGKRLVAYVGRDLIEVLP